MHTILLLLDHRENAHLLAEWLSHRYQVRCPEMKTLLPPLAVAPGGTDLFDLPPESPLEQPFDLCILDGRTLDRLRSWVETKKAQAQPLLLPFLLVTPRTTASMATRHLWKEIDDLLLIPTEKVELQARVEVLLRSRQLSLTLQQRNLELQTARAQLQQEIAVSEQARRDVQQSEEKFRTLLEAAPDAIVITEQDGKIVLVNSLTEQAFGYQRQELLGNSVAILLPELLAEQETRLELWARRKDQSEFPVDVNLRPIHTPIGRLTTAVIRDVTLQKQAETEIRHALAKEKELNDLKSRFVSMVSHEFRNPLTRISLAAHLLSTGGDTWSAERKEEYFQRIKQTIRHMTELLEDVLMLGKADLGRLECNPTALDLNRFCAELAEEVRLSTPNQHKIDFKIQEELPSASSPPAVWVDEKLLRHVLTNLLTNAIKYSPQGKSVGFGLTYRPADILFCIRDQGIGIPSEDLPHLFESFHRAGNVGKIPGTGLGLSIVKQCVDLHGGAIAVTSEVNVGTTFTVTIPLQTPSQQ